MEVVNICGFGRSGSTLLGLLLARAPGTAYVGESAWSWYGIRTEARCSCGRPYGECSFWTGFMKECLGTEEPGAAEELRIRERRILRWRRLPQLMAGAREHWPLGRDVYEATRGVSTLYRQAAAEGGADTVIDTSNDPVHALLLAQLPGFSYHAVHLVRDPRAVAHSWSSRASTADERAAAEGAMGLEQVPLETAAWKWLRSNVLTHLLQPVADSYVFVRYEDLVGEPARELARIAGSIGLEDCPPLGHEEAFDVPPTHVLAGNTRLLFGGSTVRLRENDDWKYEMPASDMARVTARTFPLLLRYGYPLRVRTGTNHS